MNGIKDICGKGKRVKNYQEATMNQTARFPRPVSRLHQIIYSALVALAVVIIIETVRHASVIDALAVAGR